MSQNQKTKLDTIKEVDSDSDFEAPRPPPKSGRGKVEEEAPLAAPSEELPTQLSRKPKSGYVVINTEKGRKAKALPEDVGHVGQKAKSERKRIQSERHVEPRLVGTKLEGALEGDEKFEEDAVQAAENFSIRRKKKYTYTEDGIPIEPFSVREEQQSHIFDSTIVKDAKKDGSWDPWLLSVEEDMQKLEREDALKEEDSDKEEAEDEKGPEGENPEEEDELPPLEDEPEGDEGEKMSEEQKTNVLEKVCGMLQPKETVNKALVRLKGKVEVKKGNFKKNVRKKSAGSEKDEASGKKKEEGAEKGAGDAKAFEELMALAGKLFGEGLITVYTDPKEQLEEELEQLKAKAKPKAGK